MTPTNYFKQFAPGLLRQSSDKMLRVIIKFVCFAYKENFALLDGARSFVANYMVRPLVRAIIAIRG